LRTNSSIEFIWTLHRKFMAWDHHRETFNFHRAD
jgi:hypothetical protein